MRRGRNVEYNCRGARARLLALVNYRDGRVMSSTDIPPAQRTWQVIVPESVGEMMMRSICRALGER